VIDIPAPTRQFVVEALKRQKLITDFPKTGGHRVVPAWKPQIGELKSRIAKSLSGGDL
jgi:hypothetical protein